MSDAEFWQLIDRLDWTQTGNDDAVVEPVVTALSTRSVAEIQSFEDHLAQKLHALDTEAHARNMGTHAYQGPNNYFSPDIFLYARCAVVANGKSFFDAVLANPTKFPKDIEFEALLYIAAEAFQLNTGKEFDYDPPITYETFGNRAGWP